MDMANKKQITDYFRSNIFEALSFYTAWKMLSHSKSKEVVSEQMANRYVEVQKYHSNFFMSAERSFLVSFVILVLHPFDQRDDSYSLYKVDKKATEEFVKQNESVMDALFALRNKLFAHRDNNITPSTNFIVPSVINMNKFFEDLINFYNKLTSVVDGSSTTFQNAIEIKHDIEILFMNIFRGETMRKKEIDIKWTWETGDKKASDIL